MAEPGLPPFPGASGAGLWDARSPRIPYIDPSAPSRTRVEAEPSFVLEFSSGQVVTVTGRGVIGRAPRDSGGDASLLLVSVDDPGRSVSKVHARFEVDAHGLWIEDLGSGNGTVVVRPVGVAVALQPGERTQVGFGAVVRLGLQSFSVR